MPKQYPGEVPERAVQMILDWLDGYPSVGAACQDIAPKLDVGPGSLRKWVVQAQADDGERPPWRDDSRGIRATPPRDPHQNPGKYVMWRYWRT